jgi:anthranilate synthase component 1
MVIKNGTAYIQTGAGIVADSDPTMEYRETIHKSRSLIQALALSEGKTYDISD